MSATILQDPINLNTLTRDFLIPLCQETAHLFRPVPIHKNDRLGIRLDDDGKKFVCHAYQVDASGVEGYASWEANGRWWDRIPERQSIGNGYRVAATDFTALVINAVWPRNQIVFTDTNAQLIYDTLLAQFAVQANTVRLMADHKVNKTEVDFPLMDNAELPLNSYQRVMVLSGYKRNGYGFFAEQGCGKTPPVINRICNEARQMREGEITPDNKLPQRLESIDSRFERLIDERRKEALEIAAKKIEAEAKRLREWAEHRARARTTRLVFEGRAEDLIRETQKKLAEIAAEGAEDQATISSKMAEFKAQVDSATKAKLEMTEASLRAARDAEKASAKAESKPTRAAGQTRMYRALVIAPKNVRVNWRNEICRFAVTPGRVTVLRGGQIERTKLLIEAFAADDPECEWTVVIASYESVLRSWESFKLVGWDLCVLDESHYIKSPGAQRTKRMLELRDLCRQRMCLTGTPITNNLFDLWAQLEFLGEGWSGFTTFHAFKTFYGKYVKQEGRGGNKLAGYKNVPLIRERLARMAYMITKAEALPNLPQKVYDIIEVEMSSEQSDLYDKLQSQLAVEIENTLSSDMPKQLVVTNILTKLLRLAQITSGFISWDPICSDDGEVLQPRQVDRLDPNPKLDTLVEVLKEKEPEQKTIVWTCWTQDLRSIAARLSLEGIRAVTYYGGTSDADREAAEREFNADPNCKVFIGNAAAGGTGLNLVGYDWWEAQPKLSTNVDHVIYYSQNWSMVCRGQSEDRAHRLKTRVPVRYSDLCVPETIDEEIRARVLDKKITATSLQDVRSIMDRILSVRASRDE